MSIEPRFEFVTEAALTRRWHGFVLGVARRITWRSVLVAVLAFFALTEVSELSQSFGGAPQQGPPEMWMSFAVIAACCFVSLFLGVLAAEEAVERGAPRVPSFMVGVTAGAAVGAIVQYLIRLPFGLRTMVSNQEFLVRITQPMLVFFDFLLLGAAAALVYANMRTARQAAARRRDAEITRLETRRRTLESRLQAMQARVEPQFLFNTLAQVKQLYESDEDREAPRASLQAIDSSTPAQETTNQPQPMTRHWCSQKTSPIDSQ